MAQTGIPFGEIAVVRDWLKISAKIPRPEFCHPKRPVDGFDCARSEVSRRRLWGLSQERFESPRKFFAEHFVTNYCPLAFVEKCGLNRTPDKLPPSEKGPLLEICDAYLRRALEILKPEWPIGIGGFGGCVERAIVDDLKIKPGQILHPSPASPATIRGWAKAATGQLIELGVCSDGNGVVPGRMNDDQTLMTVKRSVRDCHLSRFSGN